MRLVHFLVLAALSGMATPAPAADLVFGLGHSRFSDNRSEDSAVFDFEYHADSWTRLGDVDLSFATAAAVHANGDVWIGAGLSGYRALRDGWFVEGSFMPGLFRESRSSNNLGSTLEFRGLVGVGRRIGRRSAVSLGLSHKSNAGTARRNPGVNALSLRYRISF